jgi:hypothetical protein
MALPMAEFVAGLQLNRQFYAEVVKPLLATHFPDLVYAAALIGPGSDVLGFDTPMSTDHDWGPRLQLFLPFARYAEQHTAIDECLRNGLPATFRGFPVNFSPPNPNDGGTQGMAFVTGGPINHRIQITTVEAFCRRHLGMNADAPLAAVDWLTLSEQQLLEMTAGAVFHDGWGELTALRARLAYYPHEVWLYRIAAQWRRIAQEEAFMGRCGDVGDALGSQIIAARLVRELMRLAFLLERRYAPYSKWLGTAFARLACGAQLRPLLQVAVANPDWQARQEPLCAAYVVLGQLHNALGITAPVEPVITNYFNRPFQVIFADRFVAATQQALTDPAIRALTPHVGGVDQFVDSTDVTTLPRRARALAGIYTVN